MGLTPLVALGQYSDSGWVWAKPKSCVSEWTLGPRLRFPKFGVSDSSLCTTLYSRQSEPSCVLCCLVNHLSILFIIGLYVGGLVRVVVWVCLGIVHISL